MVKVKYDSDFEFVLGHFFRKEDRYLNGLYIRFIRRWWYVRGLECTSC